jgi:hypothetical protein
MIVSTIGRLRTRIYTCSAVGTELRYRLTRPIANSPLSEFYERQYFLTERGRVNFGY